MDLKLLTDDKGQMELSSGETESTVINNIMLSLAIAKGSWWFNPEFGSRLHELRRAKATASAARLAKDYIKQALKWLADSGKLSSLDVSTEAGEGRINYLIKAVQHDGEELTYSNFVPVA